jgi:hypothetical protein
MNVDEYVNTTHVTLPNVDPRAAQETLETVRRFWECFPRAASTLALVTMVADVEGVDAATGVYGAVGKKSMVPVTPGMRYEIQLNSKLFGVGRLDAYRRQLEQTDDDVVLKLLGLHWSPVTSTRYALEHELGHVISLCLVASLGGTDAAADDVFSKIGVEDAMDVSGYAIRGGVTEAFAEAFGGWWDKSNVRPRSRVLRSLVERAARAGGGTFQS